MIVTKVDRIKVYSCLLKGECVVSSETRCEGSAVVVPCVDGRSAALAVVRLETDTETPRDVRATLVACARGAMINAIALHSKAPWSVREPE